MVYNDIVKTRRFPKFTDAQLQELDNRAPDILGESGKLDYHHAILSKGNVAGMPDTERAKINNPINILIVDHAAHLNHPLPTPQQAVEYILKSRDKRGFTMYSRAQLSEWWYSINWKSGRPFELEL